MADKIDVKLVLELRQANMSQRAIAASRHISTKSVAAVWKRADTLGISYADVADKSDDEVYLLFFPDKFQKETMYAPVNYEYVHSELKKTGVTLKLLWQEYKALPILFLRVYRVNFYCTTSTASARKFPFTKRR